TMPRCLVVPEFGSLVVAVGLLIYFAQAKLRIRIASIGEAGPFGPSAFVITTFKSLLGSPEISLGVRSAAAISHYSQENAAGDQTSSRAEKRTHSLYTSCRYSLAYALPAEQVPRYLLPM